MNRNDFNNSIIKFDRDHGTQTLFGQATIKDINRYFYQKDYAKWRLQTIIEEIFSDEELNERHVSKTFSGDRNYPVGQLHSLKKLYLEEEFVTPIGVTIFSDGDAFIHPGQTRMLLEDIYSDPVDLMVTYQREDDSDLNNMTVIPEYPLNELSLTSVNRTILNNYDYRLVSTKYRSGSMGDAFWDMVDANTSNVDDFVYHEVLGEPAINAEYSHFGDKAAMIVEKRFDDIFVDGVKLLHRDTTKQYPWSFVPKQNTEMYIFHDEFGTISGVSKKADEFDLDYIIVSKNIGTSFLLGYMITDDYVIHQGALMDRKYAFKRKLFNDEMNRLDAFHDIETYAVAMTLTEIQEAFGTVKKPDHITWRLNMMADQLSPDGSNVAMPMIELYDFHKPLTKLLFSVAILYRVEEFTSPICVSLMSGQPNIDPGGTRLMFSDIHPEKIDVILACNSSDDLAALQAGGFSPVLLSEYDMKNYDIDIRKSLKSGIRECIGVKSMSDGFVYESDSSKYGSIVVERRDKYILVDGRIIMEMNERHNWKFYEGEQ